MLSLMLGGYIGKVSYEVLATPLTYWVVAALKRSEGVDVFDRGTNFNPFKSNRPKEPIAAAANGS